MSFWVSLGFISIFWIISSIGQVSVSPQPLSLMGLFYALYFALPLLNNKLKWTVYFLLPVIVRITFGMTTLPLSVTFLILMIGFDFSRTYNQNQTGLYLGVLYMIAFMPEYLRGFQINLFIESMVFALVSYLIIRVQSGEMKYRQIKQDSEQLTADYRALKRQVNSGEMLARQEERRVVARDIHDSVGHRLTALVMQLEVARYQAESDAVKEQLTAFKDLAQTSLHETREAVSALKSRETAGLQAVIQLIRKLEAESHLKIRFLIGSGVLSEPLTNEQSVVIFRSVQESLTNMMRHSQARQADVQFKVLGERYFQFSVSHRITKKIQYKEGFGLSAMRQRLEDIDGQLTISQNDNNFSVTGQFPLESLNRIEEDI
ncbi:hypothetical protein GCM10008929_17980 [Alkalibacterium psychrotolerans]